MKKILLGTTTLIGAASLLAGAAFAETPKVTLGGDASFEMGLHNDDLDTTQNNQAFFSETTLKFRVDGKSDAGLGYGAGVDLNADTSNNTTATQVNGLANNNNGLNSSRTFVYLEGNSWGRLEGGSDLGAEQTMKVDASNVAVATGGIDGDWRYFANTPTGSSGNDTFWVRPALDLQYGTSGGTAFGNRSQENLNKLTYYTPRFAGFQAGVSYVVNNVDRGQQITATSASNIDNIWTAGVGYQGKFDQIGIDLAVTGERGSNNVAANNDLRTWQAGGKVSYMGFSLAGSYGHIGDSAQVTSVVHDDTSYWTAGGSYETGPFGVSVTWLDSTVDQTAGGSNDFRNVSLGADYKLAPGLTPFVEVSWFEFDGVGTTTANDNSGTVAIVGTHLAF